MHFDNFANSNKFKKMLLRQYAVKDEQELTLAFRDLRI